MEQIPTFKLFVERCQGIHGKNFLFTGQADSTLPLTLQVYGKRGDQFEKLLNSLPLECGTCPSWTVYGLRSVAELRRHLDDKELMIKIVGMTDIGGETVLFEDVFDLGELYIIETSNRSLFPSNFVCFQFNGVRCTSQRLAQAFQRLSGGGGAGLVRFVLETDDDGRPTREVSSPPAKAPEEVEQRLERLATFSKTEEQLAESQNMCSYVERQVARQTLQDDLQHLTGRVQRRIEDNRQGAHSLSTARLESLMQATETLAKNIRHLQQLNEQKRREHVQLKFFVETRQQKLFQDIMVVYPITQGKSGEYSIRGIELPFDLNMVKDDETLSSGLGYLVHVILILSKYWEIPLRYQLLYHGSRCLVRDLAASNTIFPLFRTYNDKERFDRGVFWLRIDLEQLLQTKGVAFDPSRSLLANLMQLAQCDMCSSLAY